MANFKKIVGNKYRIDWDDVYQDAAVALLEISKRPDIRKNFSVYVQTEIINAIRTSIQRESQFQDFTRRLWLEIALYQRVVHELRSKLNREPTSSEVSKKIGLPATQIAQLKTLYRATHDYEILDLTSS